MHASDELVDVVDEHGRPVAVVTRAEMRARRLPHRATYILVFNSNGDIFIHLRTPGKDVFPSHWDVAIGGVVAAGESFDQGARREVIEELGVDPPPLQVLFPIHYADDRNMVYGMAYRADHDGPFRLQPEEIVRGEFVPPESVLEKSACEPFCPDGILVLRQWIGNR